MLHLRKQKMVKNLLRPVLSNLLYCSFKYGEALHLFMFINVANTKNIPLLWLSFLIIRHTSRKRFFLMIYYFHVVQEIKNI